MNEDIKKATLYLAKMMKEHKEELKEFVEAKFNELLEPGEDEQPEAGEENSEFDDALEDPPEEAEPEAPPEVPPPPPAKPPKPPKPPKKDSIEELEDDFFKEDGDKEVPNYEGDRKVTNPAPPPKPPKDKKQKGKGLFGLGRRPKIDEEFK